MPGELSLLGSVITVVLVLMLAYWCSRFLGKNWSKAAAGRNMKVIEQIQLGPDKKILLIKLKDHNYLVGVSQAGIQLLADVEGQFEEAPANEDSTEFPAFRDHIKKYASLYRNHKGGDR